MLMGHVMTKTHWWARSTCGDRLTMGMGVVQGVETRHYAYRYAPTFATMGCMAGRFWPTPCKEGAPCPTQDDICVIMGSIVVRRSCLTRRCGPARWCLSIGTAGSGQSIPTMSSGSCRVRSIGRRASSRKVR